MAMKTPGLAPSRTLVLHEDLFSVQVAEDGTTLVTGGWGGARAWNFTTGKALRVYTEESEQGVNWASYMSSDGSRVVAGYGDLSLTFYEGQGGKIIRKHANLDGIITSVSMGKDDTVVLTGQPQKKLVLWNLQTGERIKELKAKRSVCWKAALSPDTSLAVSVGGPDKLVHCWDVAAGKELESWSGHEKAVEALAFRCDGTMVASGSKDKSVRLWSVPSGQSSRVLTGPTKAVSGVSFSHDGARVAASSADGRVYVWAIDTGELVLVGEAKEALACVAFSPDGLELVAGGSGRAPVWRLPS